MFKITGIKKGVRVYYFATTKNAISFTQDKDRAPTFDSLSLCQVVRDDCLEYANGVTIETV